MRSRDYPLLVWCGLAFATPITAQSVRVKVVDSVTSEPVPGAIVSLLAGNGARSAATLTDESGIGRLRAANAGVYRVRAERVGFEPATTQALELRGPDQDVRMELAPRRVRLDAVAVKGQRQCGHDVAQAANTLRLWDEVRKALTANVLTSQQSPFVNPVLWYSRLVDRRLQVQSESTLVRQSSGGPPFRTLPADSLVRHGFVRQAEGMTFDFSGPDANLLLSDAFVQSHCFSVVPRQPQDSSLVGLAFQPVQGRTLPDISGVLWLDRSSAELRYVDYTYTNLPIDILAERAGGRVDFARLDDGRWIVSRWQIRTPRLSSAPARQVGSLAVDRRFEVIGYKEEGARILRLDSAGASSHREAIATVAGVAYDSVRARPLAGVAVALDGANARDTTDSLGRYELRTRLGGEYTLSFDHPRLREVGIGPYALDVRLVPGSEVRVDAAVPSVSTLRHRHCSRALALAGLRRPDDSVLLFGMVLQDSSGGPDPGARVAMSWSSVGVSRSGGLVGVSKRADTLDVQADSAGAFVVCGPPREAEIAMRAMPDGPILRRTFGPNDSIAEVRLRSGPHRNGGIAIRGHVTSAATGRPVSGAEVSIVELAVSTHTDMTGAFALPNLPPGSYSLRLRSVGYSPLEQSVLLGQVSTPPLVLSMSPAATELAEVSVAADRASGSLTDFDRRRTSGQGGTFLLRPMLESREGSTLSDVLRSHASSIRLVRRREGGRAAAAQRFQGSTDSRAPRECYMQIVVDGVRLFAPSQFGSGNPPPDIDQFALNTLEGVEVYAGPAQTPAEFGGRDATCGTLVLWTRQR